MKIVKVLLAMSLVLMALPQTSLAFSESAMNMQVLLEHTIEYTGKGDAAMNAGQYEQAFNLYAKALSPYIYGDSLVDGRANRKDVPSEKYAPAMRGLMKSGDKLARARERRNPGLALAIYNSSANAEGMLRILKQYKDVLLADNDTIIERLKLLNSGRARIVESDSIAKLFAPSTVPRSGKYDGIDLTLGFALEDSLDFIAQQLRIQKQKIGELITPVAEKYANRRLAKESPVFNSFNKDVHDEMVTRMKFTSPSTELLKSAMAYHKAAGLDGKAVKRRAEMRGDKMYEVGYYDSAVDYYEIVGSKKKLARASSAMDKLKAQRKAEMGKFASSMKKQFANKDALGKVQSKQEADAEADEFADELGLDL